ncbi:MAG: coenzyme A pyrophosphatase [Crocinitomicaceae bacterium]|nr:coenzyme A pyrophosphatase [Crocinitomicaceae bacterium]
MNAEKFRSRLKVVLQSGLPGLKAHLVAAPSFRKNSFTVEDVKVARQASVVWLMYPEKGEWKGVLIKRAAYDGVHSGQIGFPGGEREAADGSDLECALRECWEEVGVKLDKGDVVGALTPLYIQPSKFYVRPYFAVVDKKPQFVLDPKEVSEVLFICVDRLCGEELWSDFKMKEGLVPGFELDGNVVWGATAMILAEISECIKFAQ